MPVIETFTRSRNRQRELAHSLLSKPGGDSSSKRVERVLLEQAQARVRRGRRRTGLSGVTTLVAPTEDRDSVVGPCSRARRADPRSSGEERLPKEAFERNPLLTRDR